MDERSEPMDDEAWFQELERRAREAGTDLFSQFFNDVLAGSGAEAKRKTLAGEWTEEELEVFAQARERKLKFINKLDALTPIEKQYLLQNTEYVIAETVEEFLRDQRDQDDMTEMPPVELAQLAESARTKLYDPGSRGCGSVWRISL